MMATVRAVSRSTIPRPPMRAPITVTPAASRRLFELYHMRKRTTENEWAANAAKPPQSISTDANRPRQDAAAVAAAREDARPLAQQPLLANQQQQQQTKPLYLKIAVRTKGCSGNAYSLDWAEHKGKLDEEVAISGGSDHDAGAQTPPPLALLIDSKALLSLIGSQMDYVEVKLSAGFVFHNPNVKETCGCGLSFIV